MNERPEFKGVRDPNPPWLALICPTCGRHLRDQGMSETEIRHCVGSYDPADEFVALQSEGEELTRVVYRARPFRRAYG